jgi:hypothetical protein
VHAVELQVEELADAQPTRPLEHQGIGGEAELGAAERLGEPTVGVDRQVTRERAGQAGDVGAEDEAAGGGLLPAPLGDVGEE